MARRALEQPDMVTLTGGAPQPERQIELWRSRTFCDCEIVCEGETFSAHRLVVASSDFMSACLQHAMSEQSGRIELHDVAAAIFRLVLEYMYAGRVDVPEASLMQVLETAARLQLTTLVNDVGTCLKSKVSSETCVAIWTSVLQLGLADSLKELVKACFSVALRRFADLQHVDLTHAQMYNLLSNRQLNCSEEFAFNALITWARVHTPSPHAFRAILRHICFNEMPPEFVKATVKEEELMAAHWDVVIDSLVSEDRRTTRNRVMVEAPDAEYTIGYTWKITNFSMLAAAGKPISTPVFQGAQLERWQWTLRFETSGAAADASATHISCYLRCLDCVGGKTVHARDDLAFLHRDGSKVPGFSCRAPRPPNAFVQSTAKWECAGLGRARLLSLNVLRTDYLVDDVLTLKLSITRCPPPVVIAAEAEVPAVVAA
jgi:hypothetical protein